VCRLLKVIETRGPLHPRVNLILLRLSQLIDPSSTDPRKVVIQNRRRGQQPTPDQIEQHIAFDLVRAEPGELDAAVNEAHKRYGVSIRTVWRIWDGGFARALRNEEEH
jgi:hypothetical protein